MKHARRSVYIIIALLAQLFFVHTAALGQATNNGEVSGAVRDQAGAVVVGASVKLTRLETGFSRETAANDRGLYAFSLLEPGEYELSVTKGGFKVEKKGPVSVQTQSKVVVNFDLQAGTIAETVTVEEMGEVVKPTDVTVTSIVPQWQLKQLPLNDKLLAEFTRLE